MNKVLIVLRHEVYSLVSRFSFWFGVLGIPLIGFAVFAFAAYVNNQNGVEGGAPSPAAGIQQLFERPVDDRPQGFVDLAGLIRTFPPGYGLEEANLIAYTQEDQARQALDGGEIRAYYRIEPDYVESGRLLVFTPEFNLTASGEDSFPLVRLIDYNLLGGDPALTDAVYQPVRELEEINLSPTAELARDKDSSLTFFLPYASMMLFYMAILGSAGMLLNSVTKEKENRVLEVLMLSATPRQIMFGKIIGLGITGLLQTMVWVLSSLALLRMGGQAFNISEQYQLSPSIVLWALLYFVLGYLVYAALMAGIGALVPGVREGSQATIVVALPLIIPIFLISVLIQDPNGPLATGFSLFPLTAPTTMMLRLAAGTVPTWELALSAVLLALTALLVTRAVAGMFRAQTLLTGQSFSLKRYLLALAGRG